MSDPLQPHQLQHARPPCPSPTPRVHSDLCPWALESVITNKASRGDGIPVELFQILKDDVVKVLTHYGSKFGKLSSGHRTGKGQFSFQSQRKAMPNNAQITTQLH